MSKETTDHWGCSEVDEIWYNRAEAWFGGHYGADLTNLTYERFFEVQTELDAQY